MTEPRRPAYLRLADELRADILSGKLPEGHRFPGLTQLAQERNVNRGVVERALGQLRSEGLVVARRGSGIQVQRYRRIPRVSPQRLARSQWGSGRAIQDHDTSPRPRSVDVQIGEIGAPPWVADPFGIEPDTPVVFRSRRFVVDDRSVQLSTSYLPTGVARGTAIMHTDTGPGGLYARLEELGLGPTRFAEVLVARVPLPSEAELLDLPRRSGLVFEITRRAWAVDQCVEVNRMILDAEAYELTYEFPA